MLYFKKKKIQKKLFLGEYSPVCAECKTSECCFSAGAEEGDPCGW